MARAPKAIVIQFRDDGSVLEPATGELYAIGLAEGEERHAAWKAAGGADSETQRALQAALDEHPDFQAHLEALKAEREALLSDRVYGQAVWMINEAFRECRAKKDRAGMLDCVRMRLKAAEGIARMWEKTLPAPETAKNDGNSPKPAAPVGKPSEKSPQSTRNPDQLRSLLLAKGVKTASLEDEEAA